MPTSVNGTPNTLAARRAAPSSSKSRLSEKPTAKAVGGWGNPSRMTSVMTVESTPPERSDATGTSDISWRLIAAARLTRSASFHSDCVAGTVAGANRAWYGWNAGGVARESPGIRKKCPGRTFQAFGEKGPGEGTKRYTRYSAKGSGRS